MEAVKDRFTRVGWNSGPLVIDANLAFVADAGGGDLDQTAGRREAHRIVEDVVDRARQPVGLAHHDRRIPARARESDACIAGLAARFPAVDQLLDQWTKVDPVE